MPSCSAPKRGERCGNCEFWRSGYDRSFVPMAVDAELDRELTNHLEALTEENIASGMDAKEARLAALRSLGNPGLLAEQCRDQRRIGLDPRSAA